MKGSGTCSGDSLYLSIFSSRFICVLPHANYPACTPVLTSCVYFRMFHLDVGGTKASKFQLRKLIIDTLYLSLSTVRTYEGEPSIVAYWVVSWLSSTCFYLPILIVCLPPQNQTQGSINIWMYLSRLPPYSFRPLTPPLPAAWPAKVELPPVRSAGYESTV